MADTRGTALILGASRGLGLAMAREYVRRGWSVIGTVRGERTQLHELEAVSDGKVSVETLDVREPEQLAALRARLDGRRIDVLFVNAGISNGPKERIDQVSVEMFTQIMITNAFSPLRAIDRLDGLVAAGGVIAAMSSALGSVSRNETGGWEVYRASKAALNTLMRSYWARNRDRCVVVVTPGWVQTDMGGPGAPLTVEESIPGVVDALAAAAGVPGVRFVDYRGEQVAW
jgi:NAD(P)-dependent dehydrogenase (short-subunit alcohol dehydrogenase family)